MSGRSNRGSVSVVSLFPNARYTSSKQGNTNARPKYKCGLRGIVQVFLLLPVLGPALLTMFALSFFNAGPILRQKTVRTSAGVLTKLLYFNTSHSLARLAQFWNLLKGEVNLIGPLPETCSVITNTISVEIGIFSPNQSNNESGLLPIRSSNQNYPAFNCSNLFSETGVALRTILGEFLPASKILNTKSVFDVFGIHIANMTLDQALAWIRSAAKGNQTSFLAYVNAHCLNVAYTDPAFRLVLKKTDMIFPDGVGIKIAARHKGIHLLANLNGTDLFPHICELAAEDQRSLYLLGSHPGVADTVANTMCKRYPDLIISGTHHGYYSADDESKIIDEINLSGTDILLVAMGVPQQEKWIARNRKKLDVRLIMGVGGLFDFYSGGIPRAPVWMRDLCIEWIWRLYQEPRRMWRRYVIGNPLFIYRLHHENRISLARRAHICRTPMPALCNVIGLVEKIYCSLADHGFSFLKRGMDIVLSALGLLLITPLLILIMFAIKLDSPGPVLFSQTRVGKYGKQFLIWKFRSMHVGAAKRQQALQKHNAMQGGVTFKMARDPRITMVGRPIRKLSLDELPQLWNVLIGDMSLVGPRPPLPSEVNEYTFYDRHRLDVTPGITCLWQVSGRSLLPFKQQVKLDIEYIRNSSLFQDIKILLKTIPATITGRGAC